MAADVVFLWILDGNLQVLVIITQPMSGLKVSVEERVARAVSVCGRSRVSPLWRSSNRMKDNAGRQTDKVVRDDS